MKALEAAGHGPVFHDIRAAPVARDDLELWLKELGPALLNTRSTTWRGLSEAERAGDPVDLMLAHPTLMKRPVLRGEDGALSLGWGKDVQAKFS